MVYAFNASTGNIFAGYQGPGTNGTQLYFPIGLYLDSSSNSLIIANNLAHNIVRWELNASNWTLVVGSINGSYGSTSTLLCYPYDVILDPMGNVYVADTGNQRIQFYPTGQSYGVTIAGVTSVSGNSSTLFNSPASLALDSQLNLYVSDFANQRIQKFSRY
jgi:sugar lactone lactonase YvrE